MIGGSGGGGWLTWECGVEGVGWDMGSGDRAEWRLKVDAQVRRGLLGGQLGISGSGTLKRPCPDPQRWHKRGAEEP